MSNLDKFCVFIISWNRPDKNYTLKLLESYNYKGKIYIIVDDKDPRLLEYKKLYKENLLIFSKENYYYYDFDRMDNFGKTNCVSIPRNTCWYFAKKLGFKYFAAFDDDYMLIEYTFNNEKVFYRHKVNDNNRFFEFLFSKMIDMLNTDKRIICMTIAQGGDFLGGKFGKEGSKIYFKRKAMNTFICDVDKPFEWLGTLNEDVNAYLHYGKIGKIMFMSNIIGIDQMRTQTNKGGLTDIYLDVGTYVKSFYSIMINPSAVRLFLMGNIDMRIHHKIIWKYAVPKILKED